MFNVGGAEFLVIALIALIVLGPTRLPDAARQVGKAMGELRRLSNGFQSELKGAFDEPVEEPSRPVSPARNVLGVTDAPSDAVEVAQPAEPDAATTKPSRPRRTTPLRAEPKTSGSKSRSKA